MRRNRIGVTLLGVFLSAAPASAEKPTPAAVLFIGADPVQPAGGPVILELTVVNTGPVPIRYWWGGPGDYPDANGFFARIERGDHKLVVSLPIFNGQDSSGTGRTRMVEPGGSVRFPAAIRPFPAGRYRVRVGSDGRSVASDVTIATGSFFQTHDDVGIEIASDPKLQSIRDKDIVAKVRSGDRFAQYICASFPSAGVASALQQDLMGPNVITAERAMDGLWGDGAPPNDSADVVAQAIEKHLQPPVDGYDFAMMERLLEMATQLDSRAIQSAVSGAAVARAEGRVHHAAIHALMAKLDRRGRLPAALSDEPSNSYTLGVLLSLARGQDPVERKFAYRALAGFPRSPAAVAAIRAGTADPDENVRNIAHQALIEVTPDAK